MHDTPSLTEQDPLAHEDLYDTNNTHTGPDEIFFSEGTNEAAWLADEEEDEEASNALWQAFFNHNAPDPSKDLSTQPIQDNDCTPIHQPQRLLHQMSETGAGGAAETSYTPVNQTLTISNTPTLGGGSLAVISPPVQNRQIPEFSLTPKPRAALLTPMSSPVPSPMTNTPNGHRIAMSQSPLGYSPRSYAGIMSNSEEPEEREQQRKEMMAHFTEKGMEESVVSMVINFLKPQRYPALLLAPVI
jgi:hypothetical protein